MHSIVEKARAALQWFVAANLGMKVLVVAGTVLALLIAVALPALVFLVALVTAIISGIVHLLRRDSGGGQRAGQLAVASTVTMVVFIFIAVASAPDTDEVADTQESGEEAAVQADSDQEDARAEEEAAEEEREAEEEAERQRIEEEEAEEERRAEEEAERQAEEEAAAEEERRAEEEAAAQEEREAEERAEREAEEERQRIEEEEARVEEEAEHPEQRVEDILDEEFGGGFLGSGEFQALRDVEVAETPEGKRVTVHYDGGYSRDGDMFRMADINEALYTSDMDIAAVYAASYRELVNTETGEESEELVWRTELEAERANEINWENSNAIDWDTVLTTQFIHPVRVE